MKEVPQSLDKIAEMEREVTISVDNIYKKFKDVDFPFNEELFEELANKIFYLVKWRRKYAIINTEILPRK